MYLRGSQAKCNQEHMDLQRISSDFMKFQKGDTLRVVTLNSLVIPVNEGIIRIELHAAEVDEGIVLQLIASFAGVLLCPAQALKFFFCDRPLRAGIDPILQGLIVVLAGTEMGQDSGVSDSGVLVAYRGLIRFMGVTVVVCIADLTRSSRALK